MGFGDNPPNLKVQDLTFKVVYHSDLEKFIFDELELTYKLAYDMECLNDSYLVIKIAGKEPLDEHAQYDLKEFYAFEENKPSGYMLQTIMQVLVNQDSLAPGNYLIQVSW